MLLKLVRTALGLAFVAHSIKNLPAVQETWVRSLGWQDPLEKEMATHSSSIARGIPWTEEPGGIQSTEPNIRVRIRVRVRHRVRHD